MSYLDLDNVRPSAGGTYRNLPRGTAAAWVYFQVPATTPGIIASLNVSSLTDTGVGDTDYNLTNALDTLENGAALGTNNEYSPVADTYSRITGAGEVRLLCRSTTGTGIDYDLSGVVFGDLA